MGLVPILAIVIVTTVSVAVVFIDWSNLNLTLFQISSRFFFAPKCLEKTRNAQFWPFQISYNLFTPRWWGKFGMPNFGSSEFLTMNLFALKWLKENWNAQFWPFQISPSLFGAKLGIPNFF